jgi:hypothetical protein
VLTERQKVGVGVGIGVVVAAGGVAVYYATRPKAAAPVGSPAAFAFVSNRLGTIQVVAGQYAEVTVSVRNTGGTAGSPVLASGVTTRGSTVEGHWQIPSAPVIPAGGTAAVTFRSDGPISAIFVGVALGVALQLEGGSAATGTLQVSAAPAAGTSSASGTQLGASGTGSAIPAASVTAIDAALSQATGHANLAYTAAYDGDEVGAASDLEIAATWLSQANSIAASVGTTVAAVAQFQLQQFDAALVRAEAEFVYKFGTVPATVPTGAQV